jgi:hypothetical protein
MPGRALPERNVTLVLLGRGGDVLGATDPFAVETPWWLDTAPIVERFAGIAVLRMLEVEPAPGFEIGGNVTYLVEALDPLEEAGAALGPLRPWPGRIGPDPLRMPWAESGGPAADLAWAAEHVEIAGAPQQHRTWNLSAIWALPTRDGQVWLKCLPPFCAHEPAVLGLLSDQRVPRVLASEGHRVLLADLPGEDGYLASVEVRRVLIDLLVGLQSSTRDRIADLESAGVPDRRWPALLSAAEKVVMRWAPDDRILRRLIDTSGERVQAIGACGVPDVLVHGDAHGGNARIGRGADPGIWFDWGDCRIGHAVLDVAVLLRSGTEAADTLIAHWLDSWAKAVPGCDPHRAWQLVKPLAALGDAVVYQGFLDQIEASEQPYHRNDVLPCLARAAQLASLSD